MHNTTDFLLHIRQLTKLYESFFKDVCTHHGLTQMELHILSFLIHNPTRDTAGDIVHLRMLPKGHVSQGVEALIQKGLLHRQQDSLDRRRQHLTLTAQAASIAEEIKQRRIAYETLLFTGFSEEERMQYAALNQRIAQNAKIALEGNESI